MKRLSTIILLAVLTLSVSAQNHNRYNYYTEKFSVGFGYNYCTSGDITNIGNEWNVETGGMNINMTIYNVYLDCSFWGPQHHRDYRVDRWYNEKKNFSAHIGYRFHIKYFGITPIVGYTNISEGYTDGYDWHCTSNGISNRYVPECMHKDVDFGGLIDYDIPLNDKDSNGYGLGLKIYAGATKHNLFAGLALVLN